MRAGAARGWGSLADFALRAAFLYYLIAILLGIGRVAGTVGRPYGGFVWLHDDVQGMMVGFETGADWPALRAGMRLDDVIVRIDGRAIPLDGNPDVIGQVYAATPVGEPVEYEVARPGAPGLLHFRVPVGLFTPRRAAEAYLPFAAAALSLWAMGFFVYVVSARDRVASLFALWSLSFSAILGYHGFNGFVHGYYVSTLALCTMYAPVWPLFNAISVHFFARFPARHAWWDRWAVPIYTASGLAAVAYTITFLPHGPRGPRQGLLLVTALGSVAASFWAVMALWRAYRRSSSWQVRRQVTITALGFCLGIIVPFLATSSYILFRPYPAVWWSPLRLVGERPVADSPLPLPLLLLTIATVFPALTAIAILRYRVFTAKLALAKTIAGVLLLGSLVLAYVACVYATEWAFSVLALDRALSEALLSPAQRDWLSHLLATVAVAVLFGPLRDGLQAVTLRLLHPYRMGPAEATRRLLESVREPGPQDGNGDRPVSWTVASALERILHVEAVYLWFYMSAESALERVDGRARDDVARLPISREDVARLRQAPVPWVSGQGGEFPAVLGSLLSSLGVRLCVPLVYGTDELVGLVAVAERTDGVPFDRDDRDLVAHLAGYVLLLLKNERTIHELRQARQRGAVAEERERKRLAEELHDLTLQQLGFLATVQLELCRRSLGDPARADEAIGQAQSVARQAAADLRQVLSDLSPDVISRRGLVAAVESFVSAERPRAERAGTALLLEVEGQVQRHPAQELALFRCIHEAVRNALAHAAARTVRVVLRCQCHGLSVSVADDGRGFDALGAGDALRGGHLGLQAMRDRIAAVSGTLRIESTAGSGSVLRADVPLPGHETGAPAQGIAASKSPGG